MIGDERYPRQLEDFDFEWDCIGGFGEQGGYMDFWSFYSNLVAAAPIHSNMVEIGCYHGRSLVCLGLQAKKSGKNLSIIGIDNNVMGGNKICHMNIAVAKLDPETILLDGESVDIASRFADNSVFAVFIDGSHTHEQVEADIRAWMPKVMPGGWLAGHDFRMHTVAQPVCALFGFNEVIYDSRWADIWIVPKCEPRQGVDIRQCNGRMPPQVDNAWKP